MSRHRTFVPGRVCPGSFLDHSPVRSNGTPFQPRYPERRCRMVVYGSRDDFAEQEQMAEEDLQRR